MTGGAGAQGKARGEERAGRQVGTRPPWPWVVQASPMPARRDRQAGGKRQTGGCTKATPLARSPTPCPGPGIFARGVKWAIFVTGLQPGASQVEVLGHTRLTTS